MYLVAIAWIYVVLMMAVAEAVSPQGSLLGAFFTLLLYGALPLSIVVYILGTPGRRRKIHAREMQERAAAAEAAAQASAEPDAGGHAAGAAGPAIAPVRKEP